MAVRDDSPPMLSIVVPAFNEAERIGNSIEKIDEFMRRAKISFELIVVDDGSADNTPDVIKKAHVKDVHILRNSVNHGKGHAVRQGVLAATGKYVLFTDADLSAPIEEASKLLDAAVNDGMDVVIGSRAIDRRTTSKNIQARYRELGGIGFQFYGSSVARLADSTILVWLQTVRSPEIAAHFRDAKDVPVSVSIPSCYFWPAGRD